MSGIKNIFQQYGNIVKPIKGNDIWARNEAFLQTKLDVYCRACGKTIEMPSADGPGSYGMDIYQMEIQHQIHQDCARELDRNGIKY